MSKPEPDRYRRDSLGFVDEGLNFAVEGFSVKTSSVPDRSEVWGELFIDAAGGANFKFHVEKGVGARWKRSEWRTDGGICVPSHFLPLPALIPVEAQPEQEGE